MPTQRPVYVRRASRLLAAAVATAAALTVWAVAEFAFGIDLQSPANPGRPSHDIGAANVALAAITASLAGWTLLAVLERLTSHARTVWAVIAVVALALSLGAPLNGAGITPANQAVLVALHVVVAAVLVPTLWRSSAKTSRPPNKQKAGSDRARVAADAR